MSPIEASKRIDMLDYLRGFALVGILLVNLPVLLSVKFPGPDSPDAHYQRFLYVFVEGRFYTIFSFLFGVGFYLFLSRANEKGKNGTVLFLRRMAALLLIGLVHYRFHPGEALTLYAVCGLLILPFYKAPKAFNLVVGLLMLLVLSAFAAKIFMTVPLMLLGIAAGQYQIFEQLSRKMKKVAVFTAVTFVLGVLGILFQLQFLPSGSFNEYAPSRFLSIGVIIGPIISALYVGFLILLLQFSFVQKVLSPLKSYGRMALTNYIFQTVLMLVAGSGFCLSHHITYIQSLLLCMFIYFVQLTFSIVWLRFFRFGPLEWLWRMVTYLEVLPIKKRA